MKSGREHVVPLSEAATAVFLLAQQFRTNASDIVFPGLKRATPLSDMALTKLLRDLSIPFTVHGFRTSFRGWVAEETEFAGELAERALAHVIPGKAERAYNRTLQVSKRLPLMEAWGTFCLSSSAP
jgi:integrase